MDDDVNIFSCIPYFLFIATVVFGFSLLPIKGLDDEAASSNRYGSIDGLRGFLAISVFFHHFSIWHEYGQTGVWRAPPSYFYNGLGKTAVFLFFMITGYLFWRKIIQEKSEFNWVKFYIGRVFRLGPLYVPVAAIVLLVVGVRSEWTFHDDPIKVSVQVVKWLALGFWSPAIVNGMGNVLPILAGVTWTLRWEWLFYFGLPVLFLIGKCMGSFKYPIVLGALVIGVGVIYSSQGDVVLIACFLGGMVVASLRNAWVRLNTGSIWFSVLCIALLIPGLVGWVKPQSMQNVAFLTLFFFFIVRGVSIFGLLRTKGALRLGAISYSLYLIHGLVLTAVFSIENMKGFAQSSVFSYWMVGAVALTLLSVCAVFSYLYIEKPGISLGRFLGNKLLPGRDGGLIDVRQ